MPRQDPLRGFRFILEIDEIASGGFTRVKGLAREAKFESYREGGVNEYEHKLITQVSYPVLVLERGLALDDLWTWAQDAADGNVTRKTLRIRLQDEANEKAWAWQIESAIPVKWTVSDLDAQTSPVVMESLELAHHGLRKAT
ncbi:MAG: phage tail protein [Acidobacteriota bacterium]|nr:phage tail protein [Acidobacteriota bacterium]